MDESSKRTLLRILCIEDHPLDRELLARQFDRVNLWDNIQFEVTFASTLGEGLILAQRQPVDVCVVDLVLPDSRGIETLHALRRVLPNVAVVVVTGDSGAQTLRHAVYAKVQGYLVKGEYTSEMLIRSVIAAWERAQLEYRLEKSTEQLRRWQAQYRALLEFLPDAVIMTNAEGRILYLNQAAQELIGRSSGELLGQELTHPAVAAEFSGDIAIPSREGRLRYVILRTMAAIIEGEAVRLYFLHDVTDRRILEEHYRNQQRAELLGTLASGIAHELNNLLSPIMLGVQTLLRTNHDERSVKVLSMIEQSAKRGADLIRQLLNYARSQDAYRKFIRPYEIVDEVVEYYRRLLPSTIALDTSAVDRTAVPFYADPYQVRQVLINLLRNAVEAIGERQGTIRIAAYQTERNDYRLASKGVANTSYIVFEVTDDGCGIPDEIHPRIFEPFFTTKQQTESVGLGLYTVLMIVKRHQGTIHVESRPGGGTTMSVFFPVVETVPRDKTGVLIISPSPTLRQLVQVTLSGIGFEVVQVDTLSEALGVFIRSVESIELVVADDDSIQANMEKLCAIKELKPEVRIILLCSLLGRQSLAELDRSIVEVFIAKPISEQILLDALSQLFPRTERVP